MGNLWSKFFGPKNPEPEVVEQLRRMYAAEEQAKAAEKEAKAASEHAREAKQEAEEASALARELMVELQKLREKFAANGTNTRESGEKIRRMEAAIREAAKKEQKARKRMEEAEEAEAEQCLIASNLKPTDAPSPDEIEAAKERIQYDEQLFHIAVVGVAGSGKSSLINALRGLHNNSPESAPTGVTETTVEVKRYPSANSRPIAWYDIPGAGTLSIPSWQYFRTQGLYVFDCIIVLMSDRFTETDVAILDSCRQLKIPAYIVRSKADQHIRNITDIEMRHDTDDENADRDSGHRKHYKAARKQFIERTKQSVKSNLQRANLPDQRVYIVSANELCRAIQGRKPQETIDEVDLLRDLYLDAQESRGSDAQDLDLRDFSQWVESFRGDEPSWSSSSQSGQIMLGWEPISYE